MLADPSQPKESESTFKQDSQVLACTLKFEKYWFQEKLSSKRSMGSVRDREFIFLPYLQDVEFPRPEFKS